VIKSGTAIVDIGGSSVQISVFDKDKLFTTQNIRIGKISTQVRFHPLARNNEHYEKILTQLMDLELTGFGKLYQKDRQIKTLIATNRELQQLFKPLAEKERVKVIEPAIHPTDGPLLMGEVVNAVALQAPDDTVLVTDVGQNQLFATRYFKYLRNRSICTSGGLGTMGYSMPAAIGAAFGAPERTVVSFSGDGGFQMNIQELGTIMEQQSPVKMVLMNNNYLGNVRQWQDMFWKRRKSFTRMHNPCYEMIARGYGIPYEAVTDRKCLADAIRRMFEAKGPYILECAILEDDDVLPMTPPGMSVDDMMLEIHV
jgi:acetolactate synthase-1/2/3 large subunit